MRICPMCQMSGLSEGHVCQFCDYDVQKPVSELSQTQINDMMSLYEHSVADDGGYRIITVKNIRDIALRGGVSLPPFVTEIADGAFSSCKFISVIELPHGLKSIGENAFGGCQDLFDVFIPETVTNMGKAVFADCYFLKNIRCAASKQPLEWDVNWLDGCNAEVTWGCHE